jgi:PadR family transcriptional regulator, regulatory protein PadR
VSIRGIDGSAERLGGSDDFGENHLDPNDWYSVRSLHGSSLHLSYTLCRLATMGKKYADVRMSLQTLRVLETFLENPTVQLAGAEVHQRCGIASGTLYPILIRLESAGWFVSQWESIDPSRAGRPRRRLYQLTSTGLRRASEVFASFNRGVLA